MFDDLIISEGKPFPLGSTADPRGVNFALFSQYAESVELCLFHPQGSAHEFLSIPLKSKTHFIWHAYVEGIKAGQVYAYRLKGPYNSKEGQRFNENKFILDPYAKALARYPRWSNTLFDYDVHNADPVLKKSTLSNIADAPLGIVIDENFDWEGDQRLNLPWSETVIYEAHVKGMSKQLATINPEIRGTYAGMCSAPVIEHLKSIGVTAVELLPIHAFAHDSFLIEKNLVNYWGYSTLSYFALHEAYASEQHPLAAIREFKTMVKTFHQAGIEVILDVVYNHTCEGNHQGPTLSFRGIDNKNYYRSLPLDDEIYEDFTGCGNSLDFSNPCVRTMVIDSLKYWANEMHVDGFRFDLAVTMGREESDFSAHAKFFEELRHETSLANVKLIAEPWDLGPNGYQVGGFPGDWSEWNGKYRDDIRQFWKGDEGKVSAFAYRFCGSEDIYIHSQRGPHASINFITSHDGFTLEDLVSYNDKHNEANQENSRDGDEHNSSWNCGVEGPTRNNAILNLRDRQKKNFMATLFLSKGIPMMTMGDEFGKTQKGNNNAYCQDNEISWLDWKLKEKNKDFFEFVQSLSRLRQEAKFPKIDEYFASGSTLWFQPSGDAMLSEDWHSKFVRSVGVQINLSKNLKDERLTTEIEKQYVVLVNGAYQPIYFKLPLASQGYGWKVELDTSRKKMPQNMWHLRYKLRERSFVLLRLAPSHQTFMNRLKDFFRGSS